MPGRIHVSNDTYELVRHIAPELQWESRGHIEIKVGLQGWKTLFC